MDISSLVEEVMNDHKKHCNKHHKHKDERTFENMNVSIIGNLANDADIMGCITGQQAMIAFGRLVTKLNTDDEFRKAVSTIRDAVLAEAPIQD